MLMAGMMTGRVVTLYKLYIGSLKKPFGVCNDQLTMAVLVPVLQPVKYALPIVRVDPGQQL